MIMKIARLRGKVVGRVIAGLYLRVSIEVE